MLLLPLLLSISITAQTDPVPAHVYGEVIEVRVINVDVMVTDRNGHPVSTLKHEDFELFEDGERVDVTYFSRIADGRMAGDPASPEEDGMNAGADRADAARTPVTWVVYVDQTNVQAIRRNQALQQLRMFLERAATPGDRGIVAVMDGLAFRLKQDITENWDEVIGAIAKLEKERVSYGPTFTAAASIRRDIRDVNPADREMQYVARNIANRISFLMEEEARRTRNALSVLGALVDLLARDTGRVALVYVGSGFTTLPGSALTEAWRSHFPDAADWIGAPKPEVHKVALEHEILAVFRRLTAARITFYTIHVGENTMTGADETGIVPQTGSSAFRATEGEILGDRAHMIELGVARDLAESTGGIFFKVNPALSRQLDSARTDLNHYYSLGYSPQGVPGKSRKITVKVNVPEALVRHRQAVRERTPKELAGEGTVAAIAHPRRIAVPRVAAGRPAAVSDRAAAVNPMGIAFEADRPRRDRSGRDQLLPFRFNLPLASLKFISTGRSRRANLAMHFALVGPDGTIWPLESREQSLEIPDAELTADPDHQTTYAWHLDLSPLRVKAGIPVDAEGMRLVVSVEDRIARTRSTIAVAVPNRR